MQHKLELEIQARKKIELANQELEKQLNVSSNQLLGNESPPASVKENEEEQKNAILWVPDNFVELCQSCKQPFTLFRRKHHCRLCGNIFCWKCSSHSAMLLGQYGPIRVRLCVNCNTIAQSPTIE